MNNVITKHLKHNILGTYRIHLDFNYFSLSYRKIV